MDTITVTVNDAYELISKKLVLWLENFIEMLPNFAVAALVLLGFVLIGKMVRRGLLRVLPRISDNKALINLTSKTIYLIIVTVGTFVALSVLNLDKTVTSLLAGAGIIGLALGFAFQDIMANFLSGFIMSLQRPIRVGDLVETNGIFGTVQHLSLRATEVHTPEGQLVTVPNKMVLGNPITNYTKTGKRRVDLQCGISYGEDLRKVRDVTMKAIEGVEAADHERKIEFFFREFGDSSINFVIRYWVKNGTRQAEYLEALHQGVMALKQAYDQNGITIPFPIRTLDFGIKGGEKLSEMLSGSNGNA